MSTDGYHLAEAESSEPVWDEPVPFPDDPSAHAPSFPIEVFPENAQRVACTVAGHAQAPTDLAASNMLGVVSAALLGKVKVETQPSLLEEVAVWMAPALPSGERKTTTQRLILRPVYDVQRQRMEAVTEKRHKAEAEISAAERNLKTVETREDASTADLAAAFRELDQARASLPSSGRIIADDLTPEGLLKLFGDSEEVFIAASEGGLLDTVTGIRYGKIPNLDLLNKSHDGDPHSPVRATREQGMIERPLLAMAVSPQPDVLRELVENATLARRGTLARFLFSLPPSMIGMRSERTEPLDGPAMDWWAEHVRELFAAAQVEEGILRTSPQAQHVIEAWRRPGTGLEARAARPSDPRLRAFRSRLHGEVYRLAALLHFLKHGAAGLTLPIEAATAEGAVKLGEYYEAHAEIVYGLLSGDERTRKAKLILDWLEDRVEGDEFPRTTVRDVRRAYSHWPSEAVHASLAVLEERDLYRVIRLPSGQQGGRPAEIVARNPRIHLTKLTKPRDEGGFVRQKGVLSDTSACADPPDLSGRNHRMRPTKPTKALEWLAPDGIWRSFETEPPLFPSEVIDTRSTT